MHVAMLFLVGFKTSCFDAHNNRPSHKKPGYWPRIHFLFQEARVYSTPASVRSLHNFLFPWKSKAEIRIGLFVMTEPAVCLHVFLVACQQVSSKPCGVFLNSFPPGSLPTALARAHPARTLKKRRQRFELHRLGSAAAGPSIPRLLLEQALGTTHLRESPGASSRSRGSHRRGKPGKFVFPPRCFHT